MAAHLAKFRIRRRKSVIFSNLKRYYAGKIANIYSETINLPKTAFKLRIEHNERRENEAEISNKRQFEELYRWQRGQKREKEFVLHDGPPYSNGKPHMGHAVNKILKDITNRYKLLRGFKVHYVPGWDCHGLPIELKALQEEMASENSDSSPLVIRQKAKEVAEKYSKIQMDAFARWGVMADWPKSYFTYHKSYISRQLELFLDLYEKGLIYREFKPVYWSPASQTALAEAELEYNNNHKSTSIYVKMDMSESSNVILPPGESRGKLHALVWTTTPWTLPANGAVCYAPEQKYCIVRCAKTADLLLIANEARTRLEQLLSTSLTIIVNLDGTVLRGLTYLHPFDARQLKLLPARHVTASKGTGLVHSAPLHGPEDYTVALEHRLPLGTCQVDEDGKFTAAYGERLAGKEVLGEGTERVMDMLRDRIVHRETHVHSYPYDWRTKTPVIFRASLQWFIDTEKIRDTAIRLLEDVKFTPESAKQMMVQQLASRTYWCVSRQRNWGVPIPVFYDERTDEPVINRDIISHLQRAVHVHGGDFWWKLSVDELLPAEVRDRCGIAPNRKLRPGKDIMDIWFDSGSSWANVLEGDGVANVCIEGEDQLGGWFQSSLLLSAASTGRAPYRALRIHGFTLDEKGRKMSKSLGNVVDPATIVDGGGTKATPAYGADVLRLWVAQHASGRNNAHVKWSVVRQTSEEYQKIRSTFRYLLGVLSDYKVDHVPVDSLHFFDQYMLHLLNSYNIQVTEFYENSQYNKAVTLALNFLTREVSSLYCHVVKDRLYCEDAKGSERRSCQVVIAHVLDVLVKSMAPVLPYLAEEVHMHSPVHHGKGDASVFHGQWIECCKSWDNPSLVVMFQSLFEIRKLVNQESTSQAANTQEFELNICSTGILSSALRKMQDEDVSRFSQLCEFLQVSQITLEHDFAKRTTNTPDDAKILLDTEECHLVIGTARHHLCPRCRRYTSGRMNEPCPRCVRAIAAQYA